MPLPEKLQSQIDDLAFFTERADRIQALIEIAEEFRNPAAADVPRTPAGRVPGCESEVFLASVPDGSGRRFRFAVDNPQGVSAMAMARILEQGLEGARPEEIAAIPDEIVYAIFGRELSMGKSMGLTGMVRMLKSVSANSDG